MERKQKLLPGMKWQKKSISAQGEYWYDVEKGLKPGHSSTASPVFKKLVSLELAERNRVGYYKSI